MNAPLRRRLLIGGLLIALLGGLVVWLYNAGTADTEEQLYPDPASRTAFRLRVLNERVAAYQARHGSLPSSLEEITGGLPPGGIEKLREDAWGNAVAYSRVGSTYEIRSRGPDGRLHTDDDVVVDSSSIDRHP